MKTSTDAFRLLADQLTVIGQETKMTARTNLNQESGSQKDGGLKR